ncbi:MAG: hypothetical protein AAFY84_03970 [Pseudomonadota bacterium]
MTTAIAQKPAASDLRISIAFSAAILVQTALGLIWAGAAAERIHQLERRVGNTDVIMERTARLEEQALAMRASLARIERKLDHRERETQP